MFRKYLKSKSGQGMSEYLILVLIIAVGSIAATRTVSSSVNRKLNKVKTSIDGLGRKGKAATPDPEDEDQDGTTQNQSGIGGVLKGMGL